MPAGPIGTCWAEDSWLDTAWEENSWSAAGDTVVVTPDVIIAVQAQARIIAVRPEFRSIAVAPNVGEIEP